MTIFLWIVIITAFAAILFEMTCLSIVFSKAGKPSWACIVPVYGVMLLCDIAGRPRWWTLLCLVPLVNIVVYVALSLAVAKNFEGKDGPGAGRVFLPVIIHAMLAFGDFDYCPLDPEEVMLAKRASTVPTVTRPRPAVALAAAAVAPPQKAVPSSSGSVKQHPQIAKCPFCRSRTFSVVEEAGSRRCSNCHSVLPAYIQGNE